MSIYLASPSIGIEDRSLLKLLFFAEWETKYVGTPAFYKGILKDINCEVSMKRGKLKLCRSDYFCEYPDDEDYRGKWRPLWDVDIQLKKSLKDEVILDDIFIESDAIDKKAEFLGINEDDETSCIVIADFSNFEDLISAQKDIYEINEVQLKLPVEMRHALIFNDVFQLIIDLGEVTSNFYKEGANKARLIQSICMKNKGTCHYTDRF